MCKKWHFENGGCVKKMWNLGDWLNQVLQHLLIRNTLDMMHIHK